MNSILVKAHPFSYTQHTCKEGLDQPDVVLRKPHVLWMTTNRIAVVKPKNRILFNALGLR